MADARYRADVVVVGAGIAGIATAIQLLDEGLSVILLDRDDADRVGGLARWSFGGIFLVDTREQRRLGFRDNPDLALQDWLATGEVAVSETWPHRWAEAFVEGVGEDVERWLRDLGVRFFPVVHWVERGRGVGGNSVPRFHMVWGTGQRLTEILVARLRQHPSAAHLQVHFRHRVTDIEVEDGRVSGVVGTDEGANRPFRADVQVAVISSGGYCGNLDWLRRHWDPELGPVPDVILNGSHRFADGDLHRVVERKGGSIAHPERAWFYAAGVHHPRPRHMLHGLSLVPPKSALWLNRRGERIGPESLITGFDTRFLVERVCRQEGGFSWQVLNWKIARKELAVSGSEFNDAIRDRKVVQFLKTVLLGNDALVKSLAADCEDVVVADSIGGLARAMNELTGTNDVDADILESTVRTFDAAVASGDPGDGQLRHIADLRRYRGDRVRTCEAQTILDPDAGPLIAIREFILSRKSLGGIRTDLSCRVLSADGRPALGGLYAVGETAGFGGGGIHGKRSLEGTFLATCIFSGRRAARAIAGVIS